MFHIQYLCVLIVSYFESVNSCVPTQHLEDVTTTTTTTTSTTTTPPPTCPSGWTIFDRGTYSWCMKNYYGSVLGTAAIAACQSLNPAATTSGFQTVAEINTMIAIGQAEDSSATILFIGGRRRSECNDVGIVTTPECTLKTMFYWTDGHTTGTAAFQWTPTQPDNYGRPGNSQTYLDISTVTGLMDDEWGYWTWDGAVCGMLAQSY